MAGEGAELRGSVDRLQAENRSLSTAIHLLHEISKLVRSAEDPEPALYALLTGVTAGVGLAMNRAMIFLRDQKSGELYGRAAVGPVDEGEADRVWRAIEEDAPSLEALYGAGLERRRDPGPLDLAVRQLRVDAAGDSPPAIAAREERLVAGEGGDDLGGLLHLPTCLASPLRGERGVRGVLVADRRFDGSGADAAIRLVFDLLADHAGRAVESAERFAQLRREAWTDPLTGLGSRRAFERRLSTFTAAPRAGGRSLGLVMMDLDDFKGINDRYGHLVGDQVLHEVGRRIRAVLAAGEGFRYGGEELTVLLADVSRAEARGAAERIWEAVTSEPVPIGTSGQLALGSSVGVAWLEGDDVRGTELIDRADRALLRAKASGKNQVCLDWPG